MSFLSHQFNCWIVKQYHVFNELEIKLTLQVKGKNKVKRLEIIGYNNYSVTRNGLIYAHHLGKYLRPYSNGLGYLAVKLRKQGKRKQYYLHRLVAITYLENPDKLPDVNHKDGDKSNNDVTNLEWVSKEENLKHAFDNRLLSGFITKYY